MKAFFILFVLYLINFNYVYCQNEQNIEFSLKKIEDIASLLPSKYLVEKDTIIACPDICANKSIVILHNEKRQISHLGISLFSKETKEIINQPVCDFIERFLLELTLAEDNNAIKKILERNNITIRQNGINYGEGKVKSISNILNEIEKPVYFTLNNDRESYTIIWEYGVNNVLIIKFPSNRELILGTNKKESDNLLYDQLQNDNYCTGESDIKAFLTEDQKLTSTDGTVFISKSDTFMIKEITKDTYYEKCENGYKIIFDKNFPKESLSNFILGHFANEYLKIHVKHSMYGNFSPEYEMKFSDFICFFKNDFNIYNASFQNNAGELKSTIIFHNKHFNYIHLLMITTTEENIFDNNGVLMASFYSNIPQHNIKSLIGNLTKD